MERATAQSASDQGYDDHGHDVWPGLEECQSRRCLAGEQSLGCIDHYRDIPGDAVDATGRLP
jgi:hypothetical protein